MISKWTQHLSNPEDKAKFQQEIYGAKRVLDRLRDIVSEKETSMDVQEMSLNSYESPSWAYRQAHNNGFKQCLTAFSNLINLDQKENTNDPK